MKAKTLNKIATVLYPLLSISLLVITWRIAYLAIGSEFIFPSLSNTVRQIFYLLGSGEFWLAVASTLLRVLLCFAISLVLAVVLGTLSHFVSPIGKILRPLIAIFRSAPTVVIMVFLSWIPQFSIEPIVVGVFVVFPMLYASILSALNQVDCQLLQMCALYDVPKVKQLQFVYFPTVLPYFVGELPATLSFTVKLVVSAEIISYTAKSIGGLMQSTTVDYDMARFFALTILSVILATLLDLAVRVAVNAVGGKKQ